MLAALGAALAAGGPAATAATSDGRYFPCGDNFAKRVAIASGFDRVAARVNTNYRSPRFWIPQQVICADFDQDDNDEMVFSLGAMGGTDPWAFFDLPNGQAGEATYSFPTIAERGLYPNRRLTQVRVGGVPMIRETRRLYGPGDPHCCPKGGEAFRVIGFRRGHYRVIARSTRRPPPIRRARLSARRASIAIGRFLTVKFQGAWLNRVAGSLNCNRKLSFNVRRCKFSFGIGDSGYSGQARVAHYRRDSRKFARVGYRVQHVNEYCVAVNEGSRNECTSVSRGKKRVPM